MAELRRRLEDRLSEEESAHGATRAELADVEKQRVTLSVQIDASKAQLQANSISLQKRQSQFEQQKGALEASFQIMLCQVDIVTKLISWQQATVLFGRWQQL